MKTHTLNSGRFACCCIFTLMMPWGGFSGGSGTAATQTASIEVLMERFNEVEKKGAAYDKAHPQSENWGGFATSANRWLAGITKQGGRTVLPFLEEKSLSPNTCKPVRSRAALAYATLATADECAAFLPKILAIDDENKTIISWRSQITPVCLSKIETAIAKNELPAETLNRLLSELLVHTQSQSTYFTTESDSIDKFLVNHCNGYSISKQRLILWATNLNQNTWNEVVQKNFMPIKKSIEAIPPKKRIDLRDRFPELPPLPEEPGRSRTRPAWLVWSGLAAVGLAAVCAAAFAWVRKQRKGRGREP